MNDVSMFSEDFIELVDSNRENELIRFAMEGKRVSYTYDEVLTLIKRYLTLFADNGLKMGDTIVTVLPNSVECVVAFFAAVIGGYNFAPLSCQVTEREFLNWIGIVNPQIIIRKTGVGDYGSAVKTIECNCDADLSWLPTEEKEILHGNSSNIYLMTSGTTGSPKAMSIDANKLWNSGKAFCRYYSVLDKHPRFWNYLPMSYLGGLFNLAFIPLACGGSFVVSEPFSGKTMINFWSFVESNSIDSLWFVPSIIQGLLKISNLIGKGNSRGHSIKTAFLGTAPIRIEQKEEFEELFGIRLYENFALSESTFLTAENEDDIRYREQSSVGKVLPYVDIRIKPIDGVDNIGGIWIKTPYLFNGYVDSSGKVEIELDENGFFNTKDLGSFNADDVLVLAGRERDIIKKGGMFVSLVEVENVVKQYQAVDDAVAVPIEDDFYGESFVLCVIFDEKVDRVREKEKLHAWLLDNLVKYKLPNKIHTFKEFPRTSSGKIRKKELLRVLEGGEE